MRKERRVARKQSGVIIAEQFKMMMCGVGNTDNDNAVCLGEETTSPAKRRDEAACQNMK